MTISVIIPVYNVEKYIRRCLESVIAQESADFHIECLIVDDNTPDGSISIAEEVVCAYQGKGISFQIIHHSKNMGLSAARNSGIIAATGDYLMFIDSDDYFYEHALSILVSYLNNFPSADVILGDSLSVEDNTRANAPFGSSPIFIEDKRKIFELVLNRQINRNAWNKLIRRSLVSDNDIMFDAGLFYEDITWTYKLYSCTSSILIVPELTYIYENNPTSIIHTSAERSDQMIWSLIFIADSLLKQQPVIHGKKAFYAAHRLFIGHWVLKALDLHDKYGASADTTIYLHSFRRTLMKDAIGHAHLLLALYFLVLFPPIHLFMRSELFCRCYYMLNRIIGKLTL